MISDMCRFLCSSVVNVFNGEIMTWLTISLLYSAGLGKRALVYFMPPSRKPFGKLIRQGHDYYLPELIEEIFQSYEVWCFMSSSKLMCILVLKYTVLILILMQLLM